METLQQQYRGSEDLNAIALGVMHSIDTMNPIELPPLPGRTTELYKLTSGNAPHNVPEHLSVEFDGWSNAIKMRANARAENTRRLRTLLWAEMRLRSQGFAEHEVLRAFNRDVWAVPDAARSDFSERDAQLARR